MRIILITILLFAATSLFAQKTRHISVEILGAQNTVGINYDSRFKGTYFGIPGRYRLWLWQKLGLV